MTNPFAGAARSIPVTVVTGTLSGALPLDRLPGLPPSESVAIVTPPPMLHDHPIGLLCTACETRNDVRTMLFELLQEVRLGRRQPFSHAVLDLRGQVDPQTSIDRLVPGLVAATAMRDHTVAKSFHLSEVVGPQ